MNPETPSGGRRTSRGDQAGRPGDQAGTQMDTSFGNVLDTPLRPAEFSDQALESESSDRKRGVLNAVKNTATSQLNAQKSRATDQLDRIAENVRQSTRRLREEHAGIPAGPTRESGRDVPAGRGRRASRHIHVGQHDDGEGAVGTPAHLLGRDFK